MGEDRLQPRSSELPPAIEERLKSGPFLGVDRFTLIGHWERPRSHTSFFRLRPTPAGADIVVKMETGDHPVPMGPMYDAMVHLADVIAAAVIPAGHGLRPLAAFDDPALIVTPYVDGEDLVSIMRRSDDSAWDGRMTDWMVRAGAMIAAFHRSSTPPDSTVVAGVTSDVREIARRLRVGTEIADRLMGRVDVNHRCRKAYGDFGPGNLLGTVDGDLYLLDPPVSPPFALIHRDLANFVFELRRQLAGHGYTRHPPVEGRFHGLRSALLAGYSEADSSLDECDLGLIALFESRRALGMTRKRFPRRMGDVSWFARSALARRREAIRASGRDSHRVR